MCKFHHIPRIQGQIWEKIDGRLWILLYSKPIIKNERKKDGKSSTPCRGLRRKGWGWVHRLLPCLFLTTWSLPTRTSQGPGSPCALELESGGLQATCVITYTRLYLLPDDPAVLWRSTTGHINFCEVHTILIPLPQSQQYFCLWQNAIVYGIAALTIVCSVSKHSWWMQLKATVRT